MTLSLIGVNYKTAPIALREKIAISRGPVRFTPAKRLSSLPRVSCPICSSPM